jgi:hypothetical protein
LSGRSKGIFVIFRKFGDFLNHGTPMWVLVHPRPCSILEGKKGEKQIDGVSNWNAHKSGGPFHFSMGILFYKKYPQIVEEKYIG